MDDLFRRLGHLGGGPRIWPGGPSRICSWGRGGDLIGADHSWAGGSGQEGHAQNGRTRI